jgi:hypothetical protein
MVGFRRVMWIVMLESTKDQILRVDTLGQQVPLRVRYGMTCLLIRDDVALTRMSPGGSKNSQSRRSWWSVPPPPVP